MERAGRAVAWDGAARAARDVRAAGRRRVRQGQQRRRRARSRRGCSRAGACARTVFELADGIDRRRCSRARWRDADVVVDAMYGTGFRGALDGDAAWVAEQLGRRGDGEVVAVDIPSGVDGLTGAVCGPDGARHPHGRRSRARKPGLVFEPGPFVRRARSWSPTSASTLGPTGCDAPDRPGRPTTTCARGSRRARPTRTSGRSGVMVVGGSGGMTGAPMLVSHAAMRAGAGHRVVRAARATTPPHRASGGEVITRRCPPTPAGALARGAAETLLADVGRFAALAVGPGLGGAGEPDLQFVVRAARRRGPTAARARRRRAQRARPATSRRSAPAARWARPTVLTPHAGEYERLMGAPVGGDRIGRGPGARRAVGRGRAAEGPGHRRRRPRRRGGAQPDRRRRAGHRGQRRRAHRDHRRVPGPGRRRVPGRGRRRRGCTGAPPTALVETDGPGARRQRPRRRACGRTLQELGVKP